MHKWDGSNAMTMDATWEKLYKTGMSYKDSKRLKSSYREDSSENGS